MVFDWINKIHSTNQMSDIAQSKEEKIRELEKKLKRLQEELEHTREETRRVQANIEYENAKNYPNRRLDEAIARDRALAKARGGDNKYSYISPSSQRQWEIERDLRRKEQDRANSKYLW